MSSPIEKVIFYKYKKTYFRKFYLYQDDLNKKLRKILWENRTK